MSLADEPADEGVRRAVLACLDQAVAASAALAAVTDDGAKEETPEGLHALRVALRRLRSLLRAYGGAIGKARARRARRRIRRAASATGPGRDAEVRLTWIERLGAEASEAERAGVTALAERARRERDEAYAGVPEDVARAVTKLDRRLRPALSTYTVTYAVGTKVPRPRFGALASETIQRALEALVQALEPVRTDDDPAVAHAARLRGKALRYLLEPLRPDLENAKETVAQLKVLQDLLGDLHDLDALAAVAGAALEEGALAQARQLRAAAEEGEVAAALTADPRAGLVFLVARVAKERAAHLTTLRTEWLQEGGALARFAADVETITRALLDDGAPLEIERKYLLRGVPARCREVVPTQIDQGYVPGHAIVERVRRMAREGHERFVRTIKVGRGMSRIELEEECSREVFSALWALTHGRRVQKQRYEIREGDFVWEIDELLDRELCLAEIELPSEDTEVHIPEWLERAILRDVTDEPAYLNVHLAR